MHKIDISRLAWIGPAPIQARLLPWQVDVHPDSDGFLLSEDAFGHAAYVVALQQVGVDGLELIGMIRRHSMAPVIALDEDGCPGLVAALEQGADMVLPPQAGEAAVVAAMHALARRAEATLTSACWIVTRREPALHSPGGITVPLSSTEHLIMLALAEAGGGTVPRDAMVRLLWGETAAAMDNPLHAAIYRLRKRIGETCGETPPIRLVPRSGYAFAAPIRTGD